MTEEPRVKRVKKRKIKGGITEYINQPEVERVRKKRGRKAKYDPESKALNTVNHSDLSYKLNEFFTICIKDKNQIPTFGVCMKDKSTMFILKSIFNHIDFTDEVAKKDFQDRYSKAKGLFIKDAEKKTKHVMENKHSNLKDSLTHEKIIEYIKEVMNENDEMFDVTTNGQYIFDLSKMSKEMEGLYATLSTDNILKDEDKIKELQNKLNVKQLELDYDTMGMNYGEVFLRKSEIITELEGNNLNRMLIRKTKKVIKSTDEELKNIENIPTAEEILITTKKQNILNMYKTGKDIVKKV